MGISGTLININFEIEKRDQNLQNIAEAVARSPLIDDKILNPDNENTTGLLNEYLDSLKTSLDNVDVISFVNCDNIRLYHSNHELMVTVIGNLIDNAFDSMNIKDTGRQKELHFGIYSRKDALLITVDDTGVGISKNNLEHIFDNGFSTKGEGRGTGLYQVKEMLEAVGGKITVESQENIGASFTVSFSK